MYKIFADDTLIYDSTIDDYKIAKGQITLETNKSGSFVFEIYPDHFYYDKFVRLKTVIKVLKDNKIVFRGRILNDVSDYWNKKAITCEGELGFLQDSIIRPFNFSGTPEALFAQFVHEHNSQVDEFKQFSIGEVTIVDANNYIARSNSAYESALSNLNSRLIEDSLGGYFYITHGEDGTEERPTLNYVADFSKVSAQTVEFGENLKDYTKTVTANDIATAVIPLGAEVDDGDENTENPKLTIADVNDGKDYVYSEAGVALYGWIFKSVSWDNVTDANNLKTKATAYVNSVVNQNITIELKVIDLHLIDPEIESINVCDYVRIRSVPHNFDSVLLCNKQTIDLLKPDNDALVLGYTYSTFTESSSKLNASISRVYSIQSTVNNINNKVTNLNDTVTNSNQNTSNEFNTVYGDIEAIAGAVTENARNIATNTAEIATVKESVNNIKDIAKGDKGDPGFDGKSAYAYAQDGGYTGTEEEFAEKLATEYTTLGETYPVGSVVITSENTSPASLFGGTWSITNKEFKSAYSRTSDGTWFTPNENVCSSHTFYVVRNGNSLRIAMLFTNSLEITDNPNRIIGQINLEKVGITTLTYIARIVGYSDAIKATIIVEVSTTGQVTVYDVIGAESIPVGTTCAFDFTIAVPQSTMLDDVCNRFYWRRTA